MRYARLRPTTRYAITLIVGALFSLQSSALADEGLDARLREASHPATTVTRMWELAKDPAWEVRQTVARSRRIPQELLAFLAGDPEEQVRISVAINLKTATSTYLKLTKDESLAVRSVMARCGYTPTEVLDMLSRDPSAEIRIEVAANYSTPEETLERLEHDADQGVAEVAQIVSQTRNGDTEI